MKKLLIKIKSYFKRLWQKVEPHKYLLLGVVCLIIAIARTGCTGPPYNTAQASYNPIGQSEYVYTLPPITLSNNSSTIAFLPNIMLCIDSDRFYELEDNAIRLYMLSANTSRDNFIYYVNNLTYDSSVRGWILENKRTVTIYGFVSNGLGNYVNWSAVGNNSTVIVKVTNESVLADNDCIFHTGTYDVGSNYVTFNLSNAYGSISVQIPYTANSNSVFDYTGTFSPTRVLGTNADYDVGYEEGFSYGKTVGYTDGYNDGIDTSLEDITMLQVIGANVSAILNMEIFPNVKLSYLMYIGLGVIVVQIILRLR